MFNIISIFILALFLPHNIVRITIIAKGIRREDPKLNVWPELLAELL